MSKNLIPEIAKMLGVELGEEFKIKGYEGLVYKFTNDELIVNSTNNNRLTTANMTLISLLQGKKEIIKLPWKPKIGEEFYTFTLVQRKWVVRTAWWSEGPYCCAMFDKGWVFRTRAEAEAALPAAAEEVGVEYEI